MNFAKLDVIALLLDKIWGYDLNTLEKPVRFIVLGLRLFHLLFRDLFNGEISLRAASLAFTTLLSLVPLLAVAISLLKAFGIQYELEPFLREILQPLGEKGIEMGTEIIFFVERIDVGVLGGIGVLVFLYTVVSVISKMEHSLNDMWHVSASRNIFKRIGYYLSVILFGPIFIFIAVGLAATMMNSQFVQTLSSYEPFGSLFYLAGVILPIALGVLAFALVYIALPNTRVKPIPAFTGAISAGLVWKLMGWIFATFIVTTTRYHAIYSGLAILVLFMIWVQLSWVIFLLGGKLAYLAQNPVLIRQPRPKRN